MQKKEFPRSIDWKFSLHQLEAKLSIARHSWSNRLISNIWLSTDASICDSKHRTSNSEQFPVSILECGYPHPVRFPNFRNPSRSNDKSKYINFNRRKLLWFTEMVFSKIAAKMLGIDTFAVIVSYCYEKHESISNFNWQ